MTCFVEMLESGRSGGNDFQGPAVGTAMEALEARVRAEGALKVEGVWRLHRQEARELERSGGYRPCGGWRALCALAVGTGVLKAEENSFVLGPMAGQGWVGEEEECRIRLVEAFTKWLIPPSVAAGLFLAMNVHPLWGLRLARRLHMDGPMMESSLEGWRDEALLPPESLSELRKGVFAALSVLFSGLRRLDGERRYGLEALYGFIIEALVFGQGQIEESGEGLAVLIEEFGSQTGQGRSGEFAAREIVDGVLLPSGVMRRYDDDTFAVDPRLLERVRVGHLGCDAQRTWFQCFLVERPENSFGGYLGAAL